jgi:hypothetical protein
MFTKAKTNTLRPSYFNIPTNATTRKWDWCCLQFGGNKLLADIVKTSYNTCEAHRMHPTVHNAPKLMVATTALSDSLGAVRWGKALEEARIFGHYNKTYLGEDGILIFALCASVPSPSPSTLTVLTFSPRTSRLEQQ